MKGFTQVSAEQAYFLWKMERRQIFLSRQSKSTSNFRKPRPIRTGWLNDNGESLNAWLAQTETPKWGEFAGQRTKLYVKSDT